jgi:hypothetical protein
MKQVRRSVFETNSSSTHSLTILPLDEFEKFEKGELLYDACSEKLVTKEEALADIHKYDPDVTLEDLEGGYDDYRTYDNLGGGGYETFKQTHTTKSGDVIVAFGYYGYS